MKLSIVTTLYYSAPYVAGFCQRAGEAARAVAGEDYEIVIVNDGSPDNACELAVELAKNDPHLLIVDLSRNFGHHRAMLAGLEHARGERIFLADIDLEEKPEWLPVFWRKLEQTGADLVYGVQEHRKGGFFERASGAIYYRLFAILTDVRQPKNQVTARLMTRRFRDALIRFQEKNIVFNCICELAGFRQQAHPVAKASTSPSTYTLRKKIALAFNSVTAFSEKPLRLMFYIGLVVFFFAICVGIWLFIKKYCFGIDLEGWTSLMLSIWLLGGFIITQIGLCGIYIGKVFIEAKNRPAYIVRKLVSGRKE